MVRPPETSMSFSDVARKELADIEVKLASAREAAAAPGASEREKADLKLIEQEYLAARRKSFRGPDRGSGDTQPHNAKQRMDKKLDEALKASFPGSYPVSF